MNINKLLSRITKFVIPVLTLLVFSLRSAYITAGISAEQVLGDYWKDPLFGVAATDLTVRIELLSGGLWPETVVVQSGTKVRVVVSNKTDTSHMLVFSQELNKVRESEEFKSLVKDELYHSAQKRQSGHNHSHSGTGVDDAESIVKFVDQNPTVFVVAQDRKEVLIEFTRPGKVQFSCLIEDHIEEEKVGQITVE